MQNDYLDFLCWNSRGRQSLDRYEGRGEQGGWRGGQMLAVYSPSVPGAVPQKIDTMVPQTKWELLPIRTGVVVKSIKLLKTMRSG